MDKDLKRMERVLSFESNKELEKNYFSWIYPFTNENISEYLSKIDLNNKSVLTVTSSGDHALNAILSGAKSIDSFDINTLAKYFSELKIAAIKTLDLNSFINFFYDRRVFDFDFLSDSFYKKRIRSMLDDKNREFWDYFYKIKYKGDNNIDMLFSKDYLFLNRLKRANGYLNKEKYLVLREKLYDIKINYIDTNITEIKTDKKYDILLLSNIASYLNSLVKLKNKIDKLTYNNSIIYLCYLYNMYIGEDDILYKDNVEELFNNYLVKYLNISNSDIPIFSKDRVIVLKKKIN